MRYDRRTLVAGGVAFLLLGAVLGSAAHNSARAAGPTSTPTPTATSSAATAAPVAISAVSNDQSGPNDNVQSGGPSGAQVEDASGNQGADTSQFATPPPVSPDAAATEARKAVPNANPTPVSVQLDDENGQPVYQVVLATANGQRVVRVNGRTGTATVAPPSGPEATGGDGE